MLCFSTFPTQDVDVSHAVQMSIVTGADAYLMVTTIPYLVSINSQKLHKCYEYNKCLLRIVNQQLLLFLFVEKN